MTRRRVFRSALAALAALLPAWAGALRAAAAQELAAAPRLETQGPFDSTLRLELYDRFRGEFVDWFATPDPGPGARHRYDFVGNKFQLGARATRGPWEVFVQVQDSTLGNVPSDAIGVGASYYVNTPENTQNAFFLRNGWARGAYPLGGGEISVKAGRQIYSNGMEVELRDPMLSWIQANRFAQRLIGPLDYTHVGRSFDGGVVAWTSPEVGVTGFGFRPTWGGYEVDGNPELDIDLAGAAVSLPDSAALGAAFAQLVWIYYHDYRDVVYVDNRPRAAREAAKGRSATLQTVGANAARVFDRIAPGAIDLAAYGFGQVGDYQGLSDAAWAWGAEAGWRFGDAWGQPWLRAGVNSASGDPDPTDGQHQTFFQLIPTAWPYAQFPFYNMMNNEDVFTQLLLDPDPRLGLRFDAHWLRATASRDLVYSGGGASSDRVFGYFGIPADGRHELAYLLHVMATVRATTWLTLDLFYAHAFGQGIIGADFQGTAGNYGFVESIVAF